jgi:hypothetical protein
MICHFYQLIHTKPFATAAAVIGFLAAWLLVRYPPRADQFGPEGEQSVTIFNSPQPAASGRAARYQCLSRLGPALLVISFALQLGSLWTGE